MDLMRWFIFPVTRLYFVTLLVVKGSNVSKMITTEWILGDYTGIPSKSMIHQMGCKYKRVIFFRYGTSNLVTYMNHTRKKLTQEKFDNII